MVTKDDKNFDRSAGYIQNHRFASWLLLINAYSGLLVFLLIPFVFFCIFGSIYTWNANYTALWYVQLFLMAPIGLVFLTCWRNGLSKATILWMSVPVGFSFFCVILAFYASLGFSLSNSEILLVVYPFALISSLLIKFEAELI